MRHGTTLPIYVLLKQVSETTRVEVDMDESDPEDEVPLVTSVRTWINLRDHVPDVSETEMQMEDYIAIGNKLLTSSTPTKHEIISKVRAKFSNDNSETSDENDDEEDATVVSTSSAVQAYLNDLRSYVNALNAVSDECILCSVYDSNIC